MTLWFYYLGDDYIEEGWQPFEDQADWELEKMYHKWRKSLGTSSSQKAKKPVVTNGQKGSFYEIDFHKMKQTSVATNRICPIERTMDGKAPKAVPIAARTNNNTTIYNNTIPHYHNDGTTLTQEERASIARRKGVCLHCGIRTAMISWFRTTLATNEDVYKGICIKCNPTSIPAKVLHEWECRNPRAIIPPIPQASSNTPKTGKSTRVTAVVSSQNPSEAAARQPVMDDSEAGEEQSPYTETAAIENPSQTMVETDYKHPQDGTSIVDAPNEIEIEKISLLKACSQDRFALMDAPDRLKRDKEVALVACVKFGLAIQHVSDILRADTEVVLVACCQNGVALKFASEELQNNKQVVLAACTSSGLALQFASPILQNDKGVVLMACSQDGLALKFAAKALRADKEVVMTAAESNPESLKFALEGLNQDQDCLIKASLWDNDYETRRTATKDLVDPNTRKIVLSTKFSLSAESSHHATRFTVELKKNPYIARGFVVYSPNAFNKSTCDPNWTDKTWPCRGTYESCQMPSELKTGVPQESLCCWRYSFRYHLQQASGMGGMMIQVVDLDRDKLLKSSTKKGDLYEKYAMGNGQSIETEMAQAVGIKVFRFFQPLGPPSLHASKVAELVSQIQKWYEEGCNDMTEINLLL